MSGTMTTQVQSVLAKLHKDAKHDYSRMTKGVIKSIFRPMQPIDFKDVYLPISAQQGQTINDLIIKHNCKSVIEFGTSFGISTIYLAQAARQTGGHVVTTEIIASKAAIATQNLTKAGLLPYVDLRVGDAP